MPRHQLRKPRARVDTSRVFREPDQLPATITSETLFGNSRPIELEIGSGKGLFLARGSALTPDVNFVGVEIVKKYARHAAERIVHARQKADPDASVENAIMVAGNAEPIIDRRITDASFDAVHVYFPDPWWKKRHRKRRVLRSERIEPILRILKPGGRFHFWTDVLDYFEDTIEMIAERVPQFGVPIPEDERPAENDLDYQTHFERRSRNRQIPVYRVRYEKR